MTQSKISDFFGRVGETTASKGTAVTSDRRGTDNSGATTCTPGGNGKRRRLVRQLWDNVLVATYNTGSLSEIRTHQLMRELNNKGVSIALIQGIRNPFNGDRIVGEYRLYYEGSGESSIDLHAGVIVAIKAKLVEGVKITKVPACSHRALLIRLKSEFIDVTLITGYSPGDHLSRTHRLPFWKQLGDVVSKLPKRTTVIMGIDANGHIGRDGTGMVGESGAERWTENGQALHTFTERCGLAVLNTRSNCKEPGWTWKRVDGKGQGRIDYLLISNSRVGCVTSNTGATTWTELEKEGAPTDHRPVTANLKLRLLDECRKQHGSGQGLPGLMTQFNRTLSQAFEAYHTDRTNQFTLRKQPVDQSHLDIARNMLDSFTADVQDTWSSSDTIDEKISKLDIAATNVYNEFCRKQSPVVVKQKHMTPELVDEVCTVHSLWRMVKSVGDKSGLQGWEKDVRNIGPNMQEGYRFGELNEQQTRDLASQWTEWNTSRKNVRVHINKARSEYYTKLVTECNGGNATNIWNTINIIAPRKFNSKQAMQKTNGEWCLEPEEVLHEIETFAKTELKQVNESDYYPPPPPGPCEVQEDDEPTPMDVVAGFRRTNPNKAGTGWSIPNKLWVIIEEEASGKFCDIWKQMGQQREFPKSWQKQKCAWINKPGKKGKTINEKRGIMLSGASSKAYSNWTQARTRRKMKGKWRQDCFGAIPGRGTTQALLKVFATRQQVKRAKQSTITFMGDGIKAFDRISRRKILDRVHMEVEDNDLAWRHEVRHDTVLVVSEAEEKQLVMAMEDGVPQGDPNGPVLYVIGYSGVSEDIDDERAARGYEGLVFENGIGEPGQQTDICRTTFVDDHKETHIIETEGKGVEEVLSEIRQRVREITSNQAKWKVTNNMNKTILLVELFGKGSRKLRKQMGPQIEIEPGVLIKIVKSNKYLGVLVGGGDESTSAEITHRIKNAGEAVTRLRKFWKIKGIETTVKVKAYEQLVRTILVYGIETRPVSRAQMTRLECFQTRILRRIGNSQSHITHESNEDIRQRLGVPSIDSFMTRVRLRMWQKLACNPIPSVITALTGRIKGSNKWGSPPHLEQLIRDLESLAEKGGPKIAAKLAKNGKISIDLSPEGPIAMLTKSQTQKAMGYTSGCEHQPPKQGPLNEAKFVCDYAGCQASFSDNHRLQTHRVRTHGYRDMYRNLVVDEFCPMCKSKFASKVGAMNHIQKVCGVKGTDEERAAKVRKITFDRQVASGEISVINASLIRGASQPVAQPLSLVAGLPEVH